MNFGPLVDKVRDLVLGNSTAVLTGIGVAGTVTTAVLAGHASFKASYRIATLELGAEEDLDNRKKIEATWKYFVPAFGVGAITITAIVMANRIAGKNAAALAAACTVSERALVEYREQVVKHLGETEEGKIRDKAAKSRMDQFNSKEVILVGAGDILCFDILSGRYFQSTKNAIEKAENEVNLEIIQTMSCSLSEFYDKIGLPPTGFSDVMGFNSNRRCQIRYSTHLSEDGRPCLAIEFFEDPIGDYHRLWG